MIYGWKKHVDRMSVKVAASKTKKVEDTKGKVTFSLSKKEVILAGIRRMLSRVTFEQRRGLTI